MFSALEQHKDGAWWYHGDTFETEAEAKEFIEGWIWWDANRPKFYFEHEKPLPKKSCCTKDGCRTFEFAGKILWDRKKGTLKQE